MLGLTGFGCWVETAVGRERMAIALGGGNAHAAQQADTHAGLFLLLTSRAPSPTLFSGGMGVREGGGTPVYTVHVLAVVLRLVHTAP